MKSNLFDKNGNEIQIGDKYHAKGHGNDIFTVFWRGGAFCGGRFYEEAKPLAWCSDKLDVDVDCGWMEIIHPDRMSDSKFIETSKKLLRYSFEDINFNYHYLSGKEKEIITEEEFNLLIKYLNEN